MISYQIRSDHIISYHITSYRIISYHITAAAEAARRLSCEEFARLARD